jgi:hypothetical protein
MNNNITEGETFSDCTNYPKIFRNTYWGKFTYGDSGINDNYKEMKMIVDNRNQFVVDYQIKERVYTPETLSKFVNECRLLDHTEIYKTRKGGYIIITSPYRKEDGLLNIGFQEYNKLYCGHAHTYILVIDNLRSFMSKNKHILIC